MAATSMLVMRWTLSLSVERLRTRRWLMLLLVPALLLQAMRPRGTDAAAIPQLSFGDPFDRADGQGKRLVGEYFSYGGDTAVKKNFVRLTPDRQSKRGYIWSNVQVGRDRIVAVLTFRIHGQGRRWFGDGLALWFTNEKAFKPGANHGFTDQYRGVGIVLDTFKNEDHKGGHKDVTVQVNDGKKTLSVLQDETKVGCDAVLRYHAKSANFDPVYSTSRMRVSIDGNHVRIELDPKSAGMWEDCYKADLPLASDWLKTATMGITASTGALADNHDVIKLGTFDSIKDTGVAEADNDMWSHAFSKEYDRLIESETCDQSCKIGIMLKFVSNFDKQVEHWFEDLRESTENSIAKLNAKQDDNQHKIETLRLNHLVDSKVGEKMQDTKARVQEKIATEVEGKMVVASAGWRKPFFLLLVALTAAAGFAYQKYRKFVKSHLM